MGSPGQERGGYLLSGDRIRLTVEGKREVSFHLTTVANQKKASAELRPNNKAELLTHI